MSLAAVAYDDTNVFARILRGEIGCHRVFEDEVALAFMDLFPQADGHTLVIPKQFGAANFLTMPPGDVGAYFARVHRVARGVEAALRPDGLVLTQFNGPVAGQTVFHLHVHLIPRWADRAMAGHGRAGKADDAILADFAARIAAAIPDV